MLHELRVENLLLMERAELGLDAGLNVLTGETGAGKTLLAQALDLLLGGRARAGSVRAGAGEAYVEGVFSLPELPEHLAERLPPAGEELVLARRVWPDGRTRAYICGRTATVADLRELGGRLVAFYGQHEHRKLTLAAAQLEILDRYCGPAHLGRRAELVDRYERVRACESRLERLLELAGARERELDLLDFELAEIEAAAPSEEEHRGLLAERDRLRNLEALRRAVAAGVDVLCGDEDGGASGAVASAAAQLEPVAGLEPQLAPLLERLQALRYEAEDLGSELGRYLLGLEAGVADGRAEGRLEEVEERLALLGRLERKHGGTLAQVLRHAELCRARRGELAEAEVALEAAQAELVEARGQLEAVAGELGRRRRACAPELAAAVQARLAELAMPQARFEVELSSREDGCGPRGLEVAEMTIAPNPGMPAGPVREIASGGELSRVMLALLSVAHGNDEPRPPAGARDALLVFDEIDAGIGGRTARAVGEHLRRLSRGRQVLCITHLPQVAALATRHFTIAKEARSKPARTVVRALDGDGVVEELVRMLGAGEGDRAASRHARQLLQAA